MSESFDWFDFDKYRIYSKVQCNSSSDSMNNSYIENWSPFVDKKKQPQAKNNYLTDLTDPFFRNILVPKVDIDCMQKH